MIAWIRKRITPVVLTALVAFAMVSCCSRHAEEPIALPETNTKPEISLEIVDMQKGPWGKKTITIRVSNNTENSVFYGRTYRIMRLDGNAWHEAKARNVSIPLDAFPVEPGESREQTFVLSSRYFLNGRDTYFFVLRISEQLSPGNYEEYQYGVLLNPEAWKK